MRVYGPSYSGSIFVRTRLAIPFMAPQTMTGVGAVMVESVVVGIRGILKPTVVRQGISRRLED